MAKVTIRPSGLRSSWPTTRRWPRSFTAIQKLFPQNAVEYSSATTITTSRKRIFRRRTPISRGIHINDELDSCA